MRQLSVRRSRRMIEETTTSSVRLEKIEQTLTQANSEISQLEDRETRLGAEGPTLSRHPGNKTGAGILRASLWALAVVMVAADAFFQFLVNSSAMPSIPETIWVITAPFLAIGIAAAFHGIAVAATHDPDRPGRSVRLCLVSAGILGAIAGAALTIFLYARTASAGAVPYILDLVSFALWILAETLPAVAGCLSAAANWLSYPQIHAQDLHRVKGRLAELRRFVSWLDAEGNTLGRTPPSGAPPAVTPPPATPESGAPSIAASLVVTLLLALSVAHSSGSAVAAETDDSSRLCAIYRDRSESMDAPRSAAADASLKETLPAFLRVFGCRDLRIGSFIGEGPFAPFLQYAVARPPTANDCTCVSVQPPTGTSRAIWAFDGVRNYYVKQAVNACARAQSLQQDQFAESETAFLATVRAAFDERGHHRPGCTAIASLVQHLINVTCVDVLVVVTDAHETCAANIPNLHLSAGRVVILVLVPSKGDIQTTGPEGLARAAEWTEKNPGVVVVPFNEITQATWKALAASDAAAAVPHR